MAPRFAYGMTPVGNPPASKYCWFKLRRIERCVPLVPTYSAVNTVCQGICHSTPRLHWSTSGCTLLGFTARRRMVVRSSVAGLSERLKPVSSRMLFAVEAVLGAGTGVLFKQGGFEYHWALLSGRS